MIEITPRRLSSHSKKTLPNEPTLQQCADAAMLSQEAELELIWNLNHD